MPFPFLERVSLFLLLKYTHKQTESKHKEEMKQWVKSSSDWMNIVHLMKENIQRRCDRVRISGDAGEDIGKEKTETAPVEKAGYPKTL